MNTPRLPVIIQGGMGAGVSGWRLAKAVAMTGQMGVVSGTAIDAIVCRRLQLGDLGGHVRRALEHFPIPGVARRIIDAYFVPDGKAHDKPFKSKSLLSATPSRAAEELTVAANFAEIFLAKEGHRGLIGINYLEKIQVPTLASLYGAMLAGVSCVLMGAGIPRAIPGIMDKLSRGEAVEMRLDVQGATADDNFVTRFDPASFWPGGPRTLDRPDFIAIVASTTLATVLAKKASGRVDGLVIEGPTAGGHNAPPRGPQQLTSEGEPIYGSRDVVDLEAIRALGLPFWLAGSYGDPERIAEALEQGAAGVQVGTAFAFCEESGLDPALKEQALEMSRLGTARVFTDPIASPTGFPFKVLRMPQTLSDPAAPHRNRICDLGYLRHAYRTEEGKMAWRCPSEPIEDYVDKGGKIEETVGRMCLCNALMANIGMGQVRVERGHADSAEHELPLLTSGDDAATVAKYLAPGAQSYTAADVVRRLTAGLKIPEASGIPKITINPDASGSASTVTCATTPGAVVTA